MQMYILNALGYACITAAMSQPEVTHIALDSYCLCHTKFYSTDNLGGSFPSDSLVVQVVVLGAEIGGFFGLVWGFLGG